MSSENRRARRRAVAIPGMVYDPKGKPLVACTVRNVSSSGAQIELAQDSALPGVFYLALSHDGAVRRQCHGVWQFATVVGVRFAETEHRVGEIR